ncbi:MAG: bifunctional 3-deoxy-7-phosphoheptulonate synthase/chorismate mutase [Anaerolineae bacterium]|jgi:3-deoxy-7-phosphoheptulonate synthase|nr:bifunctional 3-deoxy-7-phosphoheptulonate synthase/chorismate mutase [Anaerolineae bacterium]MBT7070912.1 bifunctional 3-deoxy-7-phosphoheptulonate synthase/chorismate mutase [Anaerolineae bacterium]MBT7324338.1 bifunctional 3-deoxy-7-phosphoheptulonate synthase/chorismate mutase [Anaerolineae bacterium]
MKKKEISLSPDITIGGDATSLILGPCSVESYEQTRTVGALIHKLGLKIIRGGAFKPRTSPHAFQGLGEEGLEILRAVADEFDLLVVSEALGVEHVPLIAKYADMIQIGSRNMQHFPLLWAVGEQEKPVMLKRGFMSTIEEWLAATEHISTRGNEQIILCERGIRTFETATRNTLDTSAISLLKQTCPYPVLGDPSHATGRADLVIPAARAALAAGADGLLVEIHPNPLEALSDGAQSLTLAQAEELFDETTRIAIAMGRSIA